MENEEETIYQYYTIVNDSDSLIAQSEHKYNNDEVMYLSLGQEEQDENEIYSDIVLNYSDENKEDEPEIPAVKFVSVEDDNLYMSDSNLDDTLPSVNPELIYDSNLQSNIDIDLVKSEQTTCEFESAEADYRKIQLEDGTCAFIDKNLWFSLFENIETEIDPENDIEAETSEKKKKRSTKAKNYRCMYYNCDKMYSTSHHLSVHERTHTGSRPYQCKIDGCVKAFATGYSLKAHLRTHTGETPYECSACPKKFKTAGDLQKHVRTHTGEKPFTCPIEGCNRSFTTSNIRKVHIRSHTGERPFSCTYQSCGKSFSSATNFKNHMRIHSGEKPYACPVENCGKRFTEYSSLFKHKAVHEMNQYKCGFCDQVFRHATTLKTHKQSVHDIITTSDGTEIRITHYK